MIQPRWLVPVYIYFKFILGHTGQDFEGLVVKFRKIQVKRQFWNEGSGVTPTASNECK